MKTLRTPESRFLELPEFPFGQHYTEIRDPDGTPLRMHYGDEGARDAPVVLMLHGEPAWAYLYRKVISSMRGARLRVIAPDLVGFGRSDKLAERSQYSYARHVG